MKYTEEQELVSNYRGNRLLVSSLAGTGKTETVAYRITKLLKEDKKVLCLTFTNVACKQLTNRLTEKGLQDKVVISTVDSFTANLLKPYGIKVSDCLNIIREVFQTYGLKISTTDLNTFQRLSNFNYFNRDNIDISIAGISPSTVLELFKIYDEKKKLYNVIDFADATILATELIKNRELDYDEIDVDEAQDLNPLQISFINTLSRDCSLTFIGDKNQSIYNFAGVSSDLFSENCADWDELFLSQSFRSSSNIIDVINQTLNPISETYLTPIRDGGFVDSGDGDAADIFIEDNISDKPAVIGLTKSDLISTANKFEKLGYKVWRSWFNDKDTIDNFDIVFTSIHKAKGLEFKTVVVKNIPKFGFRGVDGDRLLYVAASRAEEKLFLNKLGESLPAILEDLKNER